MFHSLVANDILFILETDDHQTSLPAAVLTRYRKSRLDLSLMYINYIFTDPPPSPQPCVPPCLVFAMMNTVSNLFITNQHFSRTK